MIAQCVFQPRKDVNKTAYKKSHVAINLPQTSHQCLQLVSSREKLSLEKSISQNIIPFYFTYQLCLNVFNVCLNKTVMKHVMTATV